MRKLPKITIFVLLALTLTATLAQAHATIVWAYVEKGQVFVEAFFATGSKVQNAKVVVVDENQKVLLEGKTDKEGKFHYTPKNHDKQTVVVIAGKGHMGNFELKPEDFKEK